MAEETLLKPHQLQHLQGPGHRPLFFCLWGVLWRFGYHDKDSMRKTPPRARQAARIDGLTPEA